MVYTINWNDMRPTMKALFLLGGVMFVFIGGILAAVFGVIVFLLGGGVPSEFFVYTIGTALLFGVLSPIGFWRQLHQTATIRVPYFDEELFKKHLALRLKLAHYYPAVAIQSQVIRFIPHYPQTWWTVLERWILQDADAERFHIVVQLEGDSAVITGPATKREFFRHLKQRLFTP